VIGPATQEALRVPLAWRVRQVELALERLRWLPPLRGRALAVNVPAFHLFGFDSAGVVGGSQIDMRVVVGRALDTRTPMLLEEMKYVEFRPYWNVPRSIVVKEILPQLRRQPDYLRRNRMELVGPRGAVLGDEVTADVLRRLARGELRIRQRPGPDNALGTLKFVFPNSSDIYLHATPAAQLFSRSRRDFSHGCIRVQDPEGLAAWVLRDEPGWTRDSIRAAMSGTRTFRMPLTRPLPVAVVYTTVAAWPDGRASFYEDIYGHDRALDRALRPRLQSVSARD
jgi:murein L,D-transpeptidase YcbB/YkuD